MLVYEKKVDGVRHIFGNYEGTVPSADDSQLIYKDNDGDVFTPDVNGTYLDASKDGIQNIISASDGKEVNVFIGDKCIIGQVDAPEVKSISIKTKPSKVEYTEGETLDLTGLVVKAVMADGDTKEITSGFTTVPSVETELTTDVTSVTVTYGGKNASFNITVAEAPVLSVEPTSAQVTIGQSVELTVSNAVGDIGAESESTDVTFAISGNKVTVTVSDTATVGGVARIRIFDETLHFASADIEFIGA